MKKRRMPDVENVYNENGEIIEVIFEGKRYYPPVTITTEHVTSVAYRPILNAEERAAFDKSIWELLDSLS